MRDARLVRLSQRIGNLRRKAEGLLRRQRSLD